MATFLLPYVAKHIHKTVEDFKVKQKKIVAKVQLILTKVSQHILNVYNRHLEAQLELEIKQKMLEKTL